MATIVAQDLRRNDLRRDISYSPYWVTSGIITNACDDKGALLFSFPLRGGVDRRFLIHEIGLEVITPFAGGTVAMTVGSGTLATDAITTGGNITIVDADEYILNASLTLGTAGYYPPLTASTSDWLTARAAHSAEVQYVICADTTVPCIYAALTSDAAITAGAARVHALISKVPLSV